MRHSNDPGPLHGSIELAAPMPCIPPAKVIMDNTLFSVPTNADAHTIHDGRHKAQSVLRHSRPATPALRQAQRPAFIARPCGNQFTANQITFKQFTVNRMPRRTISKRSIHGR